MIGFFVCGITCPLEFPSDSRILLQYNIHRGSDQMNNNSYSTPILRPDGLVTLESPF